MFPLTATIGDYSPRRFALPTDRNGSSWYKSYKNWECNSPDAPVDPPHVMMMVGLILVVLGGLIAFGLLIDVAPTTAIKTWMMWSSAGGVVLGVVLGAISIFIDERRNPPTPPSAP